MNRPYLILLVLLAVVALGAVSYAAYDRIRPVPAPEAVQATSTPLGAPSVREEAYGTVSLSLGEAAQFPDVRIMPFEIVEDSRCPSDVQCIQAGTVRVRVETVSAMGTSTDVIALGKTLTTEAEEITFVAATPERRSGSDIAGGDYRFTFKVGKRAPQAVAPAKCYVGGCSGQICSDNPDAVSTCEYREAYTCYKQATCERQASGQCGWTETPALSACLQSAQ